MYIFCSMQDKELIVRLYSYNTQIKLWLVLVSIWYCGWNRNIVVLCVIEIILLFCINPSRAIFVRGDMDMKLHFMAFLHIDITQVAESFPQVRQELTYSIWSIPWVLMATQGAKASATMIMLNLINSVPVHSGLKTQTYHEIQNTY